MGPREGYSREEATFLEKSWLELSRVSKMAPPKVRAMARIRDSLGHEVIGFLPNPFEILQRCGPLSGERWYQVQVDRRPVGVLRSHEILITAPGQAVMSWSWDSSEGGPSRTLRIEAREAIPYVKVFLDGMPSDGKGLLRVVRFTQGQLLKIAFRVRFVHGGRVRDFEFHARLDPGRHLEERSLPDSTERHGGNDSEE